MAEGDGRYVTIQEVKDKVPADILKWLTDGNPQGNPATWTVNDTKIAGAITEAEATVDSWLSKRYVTPLDLTQLTNTAAGDKIRLAAFLLTRYYLYRGANQADATEAKGLWMQAVGSEQQQGILRNIASGAIELPGAEQVSRTRIYRSAPKRVFGTPASEREGNL